MQRTGRASLVREVGSNDAVFTVPAYPRLQHAGLPALVLPLSPPTRKQDEANRRANRQDASAAAPPQPSGIFQIPRRNSASSNHHQTCESTDCRSITRFSADASPFFSSPLHPSRFLSEPLSIRTFEELNFNLICSHAACEKFGNRRSAIRASGDLGLCNFRALFEEGGDQWPRGHYRGR